MADYQIQPTMSPDWCDKIAKQLFNRNCIKKGLCLVLGSTDTGKTSLIAALTGHLADKQPVGIVDADIGQSHIGPPATVGWSIVKSSDLDFSQLICFGMSFVGDVTPVGHLLQLTEGIVQCTEQASKASDIVIIDTPGFINGPAACALWWTVQRMLQPALILAVQRNDELSDILGGLLKFNFRLEIIKSCSTIPGKNPQQRRSYRQEQFSKYFQNSQLYHINLKDVSIQTSIRMANQNLINRLISLRDENGVDAGIGLIMQWQKEKESLVIRAPKIDISRIRCLVVGDVSIEISNG